MTAPGTGGQPGADRTRDPRRMLADLGADEEETNWIIATIEASRTDAASYIAAKIAKGEGQGLVAWARRQLAEAANGQAPPLSRPPEPAKTPPPQEGTTS
jgi:hypothetical protein